MCRIPSCQTVQTEVPSHKPWKDDDGYGFYDYKWNGHTFGVFGNYGKYNKSEIIVTPLGNFCDWEKYCMAVKNNELVRRNNHIDDDKIVH